MLPLEIVKFPLEKPGEDARFGPKTRHPQPTLNPAPEDDGRGPLDWLRVYRQMPKWAHWSLEVEKDLVKKGLPTVMKYEITPMLGVPNNEVEHDDEDIFGNAPGDEQISGGEKLAKYRLAGENS